mgnify:CR=1 FL=1
MAPLVPRQTLLNFARPKLTPMNFQLELETLIRARYPVLYIVTSEETRVQETVLEIAARRQKKVFEWSCTIGIVPAGASIQSQKSRNPGTKDPLAALDHVIEQVEPALYLFKDFHPFLSKAHPAVIRKLKEIALHLKNSFKTIILVSPVMEIPTELEKEITVLNFPLPSRDDLAGLLDRIVAEVDGQLGGVDRRRDVAHRGDDLARDRRPLGRIAVEQRHAGLALDDLGELPGEVETVLDRGVGAEAVRGRVPVDGEGRECKAAALTRDGRFLLPPGTTATLYLDDQGDAIERGELRSARGGEGAAPEAEPQAAGAADLLDCVARQVYSLAPVAVSAQLDGLLAATGICRVAGDGDGEARFLVKNSAGYFLLVGEDTGFEQVGPEQADLSIPDAGEPWDGLDLAML